jgi:hypothetical protein
LIDFMVSSSYKLQDRLRALAADGITGVQVAACQTRRSARRTLRVRTTLQRSINPGG